MARFGGVQRSRLSAGGVHPMLASRAPAASDTPLISFGTRRPRVRAGLPPGCAPRPDRPGDRPSETNALHWDEKVRTLWRRPVRGTPKKPVRQSDSFRASPSAVHLSNLSDRQPGPQNRGWCAARAAGSCPTVGQVLGLCRPGAWALSASCFGGRPAPWGQGVWESRSSTLARKRAGTRARPRNSRAERSVCASSLVEEVDQRDGHACLNSCRQSSAGPSSGRPPRQCPARARSFARRGSCSCLAPRR